MLFIDSLKNIYISFKKKTTHKNVIWNSNYIRRNDTNIKYGAVYCLLSDCCAVYIKLSKDYEDS